MHKNFSLTIFLLLNLTLASACWALEPNVPTLGTVLVTGEQPGPGLWRVSKGDHYLWILGSLKPLPKKMSWRSEKVNALVAKSQEVIGPSKASIGVNLFKSLPSLVAWSRIKKIPDGKHLKDVLPADLYSRWSALSAQYLDGEMDIQSLRPRYAAKELYEKAIDRSGLTNDYDTWDIIRKLARKHDVPITTNDFEVVVDNPRAQIDELEHTPVEVDIPCLAATMERLESDMQNMQLRANAWSIGDIDALRRLPYVDQDETCWSALSHVSGLNEPATNLKTRLTNDWMNAAEHALSSNGMTFAILPITELIGSNGRLALLREKGYSVEEPEGLE